MRLVFSIGQFLVLFAFWLVLSGHFELRFLLMGAFSAGLVTLLTHNLFYEQTRGRGNIEPDFLLTALHWLRFFRYLPWLIYSIITANLQVAYIILHPRMPIDPVLLRFRTRFQSDTAQVLLANSITITPGTITVDLNEGDYVIHALVPASAQSLVDGEMQDRVGDVFGEAKQGAPAIQWAHTLAELEQ